MIDHRYLNTLSSDCQLGFFADLTDLTFETSGQNLPIIRIYLKFRTPSGVKFGIPESESLGAVVYLKILQVTVL